MFKKASVRLSDDCERCGEVETYKHLFWDCAESRRVWRSFNEYMSEIGHVHRVDSYEKVFTIDDNRMITGLALIYEIDLLLTSTCLTLDSKI